MTPVRTRLPGALILAGTAALAVASCAAQPAQTAHALPVISAHAAATGGAGTKTGQGSTHPGVPPRSPKQLAEADVAAILASFVPPPGAVRLSIAPRALKSPITWLGDAFQANAVRFWTAPGDPQALLAWETAHLPKKYTASDADFGPPSWDRMFDLPPIPGVLPAREMIVEVTSLASGTTGIRVDANVGWQPARTAAQRIPATARAVTITVASESRPVKRPPGPVTITDPAKVAGLAALVNGLPISPYNGNVAISCPATAGLVSLRLTFRAAPHGPGLASVTTGQACGVAVFNAAGALNLNLTESPPIFPKVLTIAGLHWKLS
jgi:hypothetical protein